MHAAVPRIRKPVVMAAALALGALALMVILTRAPGPSAAKASSHSEAPLISQDPRADNTDLYAFVSPDDTNTVTMIANYIPLEAPASGPNFYSFDDSALYQIGIDQNGDGHADIGYQFRFHDADAEREHVPLQHRADHLARQPELEPAADLHAHACPVEQERQREGSGRARQQHPDAARQHRAALDAELRRPRVGGGHEPVRRDQGLRRPAGRPVLRRPRLDLRPGRAASVQPVPPDPAAAAAGVDGAAELQHALDRPARPDLAARAGPEHDGRHLRERRARAEDASSRRTGRRTGTARGCRSPGSGTRSSTRS